MCSEASNDCIVTYSNDSKFGHLVLKLCRTALCSEPMSCRDLPTQLKYTLRFRLSFQIKLLFKTFLVWSSKNPDTYPTPNWGDSMSELCPNCSDSNVRTIFGHSKVPAKCLRSAWEVPAKCLQSACEVPAKCLRSPCEVLTV